MAWLGVHAVVSGYYHLDSLYFESYHVGRNDVAQTTAREENHGGGNPRRIILSGVSLIGLVWLWVQGGALYWQYFTGVMAAIAATAVGTWLMRRAWKAYQGWIQRRVEAACAVVEQEVAAELAKQVGALERVIGQRDALAGLRQAQAHAARAAAARAAAEHLHTAFTQARVRLQQPGQAHVSPTRPGTQAGRAQADFPLPLTEILAAAAAAAADWAEPQSRDDLRGHGALRRAGSQRARRHLEASGKETRGKRSGRYRTGGTAAAAQIRG
jgi:hypothetical protein